MKRKWLFSVLGLLLVSGLCWMLVGITINIPPKSPLQKLNDARALWQAKGISNYKLTMVFSSFEFLGSFNVTVTDNQVSLVEPTLLGTNQTDSESTALASTFEYYRLYMAKTFLTTEKDYSINNLFDFVSTKVNDYPSPSILALCAAPKPDWHYEAQYDTDYGYVAYLSYTNCPSWQIGGGWMCGSIADCSVNAAVRHFEILPPSE